MLECVEIMCGLVFVFYGKSSSGGLLNMVSKCLIIELLKEVQFKVGIDSLFQIGFDFSDLLDDDGVYFYCLIGFVCFVNVQQKGLEEQCYVIVLVFIWCLDDKINFIFFFYFQNELEIGYYGWLLKEGIVELLLNGKCLLIDFNEGVKNNIYFCNEKMVGYSFDYEFNDIFIVCQNLCFVENKIL